MGNECMARGYGKQSMDPPPNPQRQGLTRIVILSPALSALAHAEVVKQSLLAAQ